MTKLPGRLPVLAALVLFAFLVSVVPTEAHALLVRSDPGQDARLLDAPSTVSGWFSEPLEPGISSLKVVDASGQRVDSGETRFDPSDPSMMAVSLADNIGPGFYLVTWETLSRIDGHFRFGSFQFAVLNADGSLPPQPAFGDAADGGDKVEPERSLAKALGLIGQVGLVGALAFFLFVARPAAARMETEEARGRWLLLSGRQLAILGLGSAGLLALAGLLELLIQVTDVPGGASLAETLGTSWGDRWLQRQVGLVVAAALLLLHSSRSGPSQGSSMIWGALVAGVSYLLLTSMTSHAAAVERGDLWATSFDFLHLLTAAVWIGGLAQLAGLLVGTRLALKGQESVRFRAAVLRRFSLLAATAAVPLLSTGVLNALVEVPALSDLVDTSYGLALLAKLAIVLLLLSAAAVNAFVLRPRLVSSVEQGEPTAGVRRLLSRLVPLEAALGGLVLIVTGVLTQLTTARALAQIAGRTVVEPGAALANPLAAGDFGLIVIAILITLGALGLIWTSQAPGCSGWFLRNLSRATVALPALVLVFVLLDAATGDKRAAPPGAREQERFQPQLSLLLQASEERFVSLQMEPFQLGENRFRVTVLDRAERPVSVDSLVLRFARLEHDQLVGEVPASFDAASGSFFAGFDLNETGWWAIDARFGGEQGATFYVKLDSPSRAPGSFAPPDYGSDAQAQAFFQRAMETYGQLSSVRWREQLTSGNPQPTGYGVWFVTLGEAVAPDRLHFQVFDLSGPRSNRFFVESRECSATGGAPPQCSSSSFRPDVFGLDFLQPTAFKFGRKEAIDGEMAQVVLFYNPNQSAWYAWWVGEATGYLRRQAMVATGHFMLTSYEDHNEAIRIELP